MRSSSSESASLKRGSVSGKCWPMSPSAGGAEQRVDDRVREHVGVGVAGEALLVRDVDAAEDQRAARREGVRVDAEAGADHHPIGSIRRCAPLEDAQLASRRRAASAATASS